MASRLLLLSTTLSPWRDVVVVAAFVAAVAVTIVQPWCGRDRTSAEDVAAVVQRQRPVIQAGDLVLVHPPWRDDIVDAIAPLLPQKQLVTEAFTRGHLDGWPAMVVVAEGVHPWPASIEQRRRELHVEIVEDSGVRFFRLPASSAASSSASAANGVLDLSRARVGVVDRSGVARRCAWSPTKQQHTCAGLPEWMHVGDEALTIDGQKQRCTWAHPITGGRLTIDHDDVDGSRGLRLRAALSDVAADNADGAPVTFTIRAGTIERAVTVQHARGFTSVDVPTSTRGPVNVSVTTPNDGQRHVCFQLVAP